jgi:hypothetical protein
MPAAITSRIRNFARWLIVAFACTIAGAQVRAAPPPLCPAPGATTYPPYGAPGEPPNVAVWRDLDMAPGAGCEGLFQAPANLAIALAGSFRHDGSLEDLAARIGAISLTKGLRYWSTTDQEWRVLVSEAFALPGPAAETARPDFTAGEILGGRRLYFAQDDTRSTGLNVYALAATRVGPERLGFEIVNLTPIRLAFLTLFEAQALRSVHFIERAEGELWHYYGLSTVQSESVAGHEESFINRAAAFYRFLIGEPPDQAPPLAP